MRVALALWVAQVTQRVDAADQLIELEDRATSGVRLRVGTQFPNQCALSHLFDPQSGHDLVDIGFFVLNRL